MLMRVLTICDRYRFGGAADIAREIHTYVNENTLDESIFLYGWDRYGLYSKEKRSDIICANYLGVSHLNAISSNIIGYNFFPSIERKLDFLIKQADIVHIHNIHTYGFKYTQIVDIINKYNKKVIITAHDDWYNTGRCSFRKECEVWKKGCYKCPHMNYYHKSIIDNAKRERIKKINAFNSINSIVFTAPSQWLVNDLKYSYPNKEVILIPNGINVSYFNSPDNSSHEKEINLVLIANNLTDNPKIDYHFLNSLIDYGCQIHLIGSNSPYNASNVRNHGFLQNKEDMNEILQQSDIMLFFSKIDSFGLILAEALCTGIHIACSESRAALEVLQNFDKTWLSTPEHFINLLKDSTFISRIKNNKERERISQKAKIQFDITTMLLGYKKLYNEVD